MTTELTGDLNKLDAFIALMEPYGVIELVRTGLSGISRGNASIKERRKGV